MTAGTTNFPGSLDSHTSASPLGFGEVNNQAYTLSTAAHTNSVTTITVASTSAFPSKGYLVVKRELISYTGTTATTFTGCTRGVGGTTAAAFLSGTLVEQVVTAANHNDLAAALVAVETAMGARLAYLTRKNRVINGDMRVNQRMTLIGTTDDSYTLDRWLLLLEDTTAWAVSQETSDVPTDGSKYALKLTADGNDDKGGICTILEYRDVADLRGKTVSLQAKLKVSNARIGDVRMAVLEWTSTADSVTSDAVGTWGAAATNPTLATNWAYLGTPANLSVTTSWATYRVEGLTVGASANNLAIFVWVNDESNDSGDYLLVTDVQLEEGPACSGFERIPFTAALALCKRYYQKSHAQGVSPTFASAPVILQPAATPTLTGNRIRVVQLLGVEMRTAPTTTYRDAAGTLDRVTTVTTDTFTNGVTPVVTPLQSAQANLVTFTSADGPINFSWTMDAEL